MNIFTKILSVLVALEFLYIFYLETIATTSDKTSNVFGMTKDELGQKNVNVLFKNQASIMAFFLSLFCWRYLFLRARLRSSA